MEHPSFKDSAPIPNFDLGGRVSNLLSSSQPALPPISLGLIGDTWSNSLTMPRRRYDNEDHPIDHADSLIKEFTTDEIGVVNANESPSARFKSSFAKEVVQNVRKSMSLQNDDGAQDSMFKSQFALNNQNTLDFQEDYHRFSLPRTSGTGNRLSSHRSKSSSNLTRKNAQVQVTSEKPPPADDHTFQWMSASTFTRILDRQEDAMSSSSARLSNKSNPSRNSSLSFMDEESLMPIEKFKQSLEELGFENSQQVWTDLRQLLSDNDQLSYNGELVKRQDFFDAYQVVMAKRKSTKKKFDFKDSMKSDSGGEMESCRSSDSELERELADKEREIVRQERDLTGCYEELANRDTEFMKLRLDYKKISEERDVLRLKYEKLKLNARNASSLEKEIDHLKWQLNAMETSRKTYESATHRLMSFLEQISSVLQNTSPAQRKLIESTKAEVSAVARKTRNRLSLDNQHLMSRAESMPGLNIKRRLSSNSGSCISLHNSTTTSDIEEEEEDKNHKIKRSQSTHSKVGLPSVNEEFIPPPLPPKIENKPPKRSNKENRRSSFSSGSSSANYRTYSVHNNNNNNNKAKRESVFTPTYTQKSEPKEEKELPNVRSLDGSIANLNISEGDSREIIRLKASKMLRSMKCLLSREKSLTITPKKSMKPQKSSSQPHSLQLISQHKFDTSLG